jgi:hypothetical protein
MKRKLFILALFSDPYVAEMISKNVITVPQCISCLNTFQVNLNIFQVWPASTIRRLTFLLLRQHCVTRVRPIEE